MNYVSQHSHSNTANSTYGITDTTPFDSAEEAWFWFMAAQDAKNDGAKFVAGAGVYKRPCEPVDILKVLDRLYRKRRLHKDHLLVLRHYGRRRMAPDKFRTKEIRAYHLWSEALERIEEVLISKGIVEASFKMPGYICERELSMRGVSQ